MTSIFSAISGQFSKALILGTFLPVVLFTVLGLLFMPSLLPSWSNFLQPLQSLDKEWQVIAVTFLTILLTGVLYNLNVPIIRVYEGYPWQESAIGKWRTDVWQSRYEAAQEQRGRLRFLGKQIAKTAPGTDRLANVQGQQRNLGLMLNQAFPGSKSLVMPTRLGNVIRSFEYYPTSQYGMGAISLWPRLIAKIDKDYAAVIDEAKSSFDFMINCSALSALSAALLVLFGLLFAVPLDSTGKLALWLAEWLGFAILGGLFYAWSVGRAAAWGAQVRGAFDLYRWDLLKQLGYQYNPSTRADERALWLEISQQMIYGDPLTGTCLPYSSQAMQITVEPATVKVDVAKGVTPPAPDHSIVVTLRIRSIDAQNSVARKVTLSDALPDGFAYVWGSAKVTAGSAALMGTSPPTFQIENVSAGKDIVLTYSAVSLAAPKQSDSQQSSQSKEQSK